MRIPNSKGKTLHEQLFDPKKFHFQIRSDFNKQSKDSYAGYAPSLFVGSFAYPHVQVGLLNTEHYEGNDEPLQWSKLNTPISDIVRLRSNLVHARKQGHVKWQSNQLSQKTVELGQESAMAVKPLNIDVSLVSKPLFSLSVNDMSLPHGPSAQLKSLRLTSNPKIPRMVEKTVGDNDLKATAAINHLWKKGLPEHQLSKLLTTGTLGVKLERRLVPTRWGITAVDDMVGKQLRKQVLDFPESEYHYYFGGYQGNYFLLLFFPQTWSYELFENYVGRKQQGPLSSQYHDYEGFKGRTRYAENTAGGYYAARIAILEHLVKQKRKAGVLALRFISDAYWAPLGVWVVRETVRHALESTPVDFSDGVAMMASARKLIQSTFAKDISPLFSDSILLSERKSQQRLSSFGFT